MDGVSINESISRVKEFLFKNLDDKDRGELIELFKKVDSPSSVVNGDSYCLAAKIKLIGRIS
jgi:hypothetical protein